MEPARHRRRTLELVKPNGAHGRPAGAAGTPRDRWPDATLAWIRDPYRLISRRCRRYGSDVFETRLMLRRPLCMTGRDAAERFYDDRRFASGGVPPRWLQRSLLGVGGVQGLDGDAHRRRKSVFVSLATPQQIGALVDVASQHWRARTAEWSIEAMKARS